MIFGWDKFYCLIILIDIFIYLLFKIILGMYILFWLFVWGLVGGGGVIFKNMLVGVLKKKYNFIRFFMYVVEWFE